MNLRHYFTHYTSLGGVQSILDTHLKFELLEGIDSSLLAFFDASNPEVHEERVRGLNWSGWTTIRAARSSFQDIESKIHHDCCIYHDLWGLAFLGDLDRCDLRIGAIHSHWPNIEHQLPKLTPFLDGVICDSQILADLAMERIPTLAPDRAIHLPVPIKTCPGALRKERSSMRNRPIHLGYVGRMDHSQKRIERFIPLVDQLDRDNIDFTLEFLGIGTGLEKLRNALGRRKNVFFHGRKSGDAYWKIMNDWDFVIYTSDFEGSPLAMKEALNAGCLPMFPRIGCGGDAVVEQIHPDLLYAPTNYANITQKLKKWKNLPDSQIEKRRASGIEISNAYAEDRYHEKFMIFLKYLKSMPAISKNPVPSRRVNGPDFLPFGILRRCFPKQLFEYTALR
jgi:glycosyltransferase involved in cell wall biosynthesis